MLGKIIENFCGKLFESKGVNKSDTDALVRAYALMKNSKLQGASIGVQQKYHDKFEELANKFSQKYHAELGDDTNSQLERLADKWWGNKVMRGAGVGW